MLKFIPRTADDWFFSSSSNRNLSLQARFRHLRGNLISTMLLIAMIPLFITAGVSYFQYRVLLQTETINNASQSAENARLTIEAFLDRLQAAILVASDAYTIEELSDQVTIRQVFLNLKSENQGIVDLSFIDPSGVQRSYAGPYELKGKDYSDSPWFSQSLASKTYISNVFLGYRNVPHFVIAVTKRNENKSGYWVLRASVASQTLDRFLESVHTESVEDVFLINYHGVLQSSSRYYGHVNDSIDFEVKPRKRGITLISGQKKEDPVIRTAGYVKSTPWILVQEQEVYFLRKSWVSFRRQLLITFVTCLVLVGFEAYRIADFIAVSIRKSDESRELMLQETEHTSKLASVGRLAAGVAHEINNPLAIISEKAGLMKDLLEYAEDCSFRDKFLAQLNSLEKAVSRSRVITHRLLGFARRMEVSLELIRVTDVIEEVIGFLEKAANYRNIVIDTYYEPDLPEIYSDYGQLQQIFLNILNNAIDAIDDGGEISITCQKSTEAGTIQIDISDNGPGMTQETMSSIFEPFFTTKKDKKKQGTGLGLSITYGLVTKLGGEISVHSEIGTGTSFSLVFPIAKNTIQKEKDEES